MGSPITITILPGNPLQLAFYPWVPPPQIQPTSDGIVLLEPTEGRLYSLYFIILYMGLEHLWIERTLVSSHVVSLVLPLGSTSLRDFVLGKTTEHSIGWHHNQAWDCHNCCSQYLPGRGRSRIGNTRKKLDFKKKIPLKIRYLIMLKKYTDENYECISIAVQNNALLPKMPTP